MLKRAKRWHLFADEIKPLPVRHEIGRAPNPEEKLRLQQAAAEKPEGEKARLAMTLALNTTMRASDVKGLCWREINFLERTVAVRYSKTDAGRRVIPLNTEAWAAVMELYQQAQQVGGAKPAHFVFPACENGKMDPTRSQKSWRSAWRSLRKAAGLQHLRFHDLRHHLNLMK
jgi:integrase